MDISAKELKLGLGLEKSKWGQEGRTTLLNGEERAEKKVKEPKLIIDINIAFIKINLQTIL